MRKRVVFIADSLDNAYKFQQVLSRFDVEIAAGSTVQVKKLLAPSEACDLVIFEASACCSECIDRNEPWFVFLMYERGDSLLYLRF